MNLILNFKALAQFVKCGGPSYPHVYPVCAYDKTGIPKAIPCALIDSDPFPVCAEFNHSLWKFEDFDGCCCEWAFKVEKNTILANLFTFIGLLDY